MARVQILAIIATVIVFGVVLELVRRRRLVERYALLWLVTAIVLLVLAIWSDLLNVIVDATKIQSGPNALFLAAFGLVFLLLLNFSVAISRLSEETKILAQEQARLESELAAMRAAQNGAGPELEATDLGFEPEPITSAESQEISALEDEPPA